METVMIFMNTLASDYTVSLFPEPQPEPVAPTLPWFVWMWFIGGGLLAVGVAVGVFLLIRHAVKKGRGRKAAEAAGAAETANTAATAGAAETANAAEAAGAAETADAAETAGISETANTAATAGIAEAAAQEEDRV